MFNNPAMLLSLSVAFTLIPFFSAKAQLLPDNTLGTEKSVVTPTKLLEDRIDGGAIRGINLFHSFQEFNIDNGRSVYFNHSNNIQNILTRVTGNNQSQILGKLGVLGDANLFIINPKGIIFGKDASLDINGSFIGSTANSIKFVDGKQFSAVSPDNIPILTISAPMGLGIENNPSTILIKENIAQSLRNSNIIPENNNITTDFELRSDKTNVLIAGDFLLKLKLVILKTKSERFELGNVASGLIMNDLSQNLIPGCRKTQNNQFTISGRSGNPENPNQLFVGNSPVVNLIDMVSTSENSKYPIYSSTDSANNAKPEIIEAQGWIINAEGEIEFVAEVREVTLNYGAIRATDCQGNLS